MKERKHSSVKTKDYDGFIVPPDATTSLERFRSAVNYSPGKDDIFVNTYPKSGTTWMIYIVYGIIYDGQAPPQWQEMTEKYVPELEVVGTEMAGQLPTPRIWKTHLEPKYLPYSTESKYIYVARNPWDTCVSYFKYASQRPEHFGIDEDPSFSNFVKSFAHGELPYSYYFTNVKSNWERRLKKEPNLLFLTYEELQRDLKSAVLKVADFLGRKERLLANEEEILNKVVAHSKFDFMRNLEFVEDEEGRMRKVNFFQTGKSGYGKQHFTAEESALIEAKVKEHFGYKEFKPLLAEWNVNLHL